MLILMQSKGSGLGEGVTIGAGPDQVGYLVTVGGKRETLTGAKGYDPGFQSVAVVHGPAGASVYRNGELLGSGPLWMPTRVAHPRCSVSDDAMYFQGDLAELILYSRPLPEAERRDVEAYLREKYLGPEPSGEDGRRGLFGEYFEGHEFRERSGARLDPKVYFNWTKSPAVPALTRVGAFSARWTGFVVPEVSAPYTFHVRSDQGARLWVGDALVLEAGGGDPHTQPIRLEAGRKVPLKLETRHAKGAGRVKLSWSAPSLPEEAVPRRCLRPPDSAPRK
jgi:hypothetical protein